MIQNLLIFICFLFFPINIRCQCERNWFGQNCSQINMCDYNNSSLCPNKFICKTIDNNQECLAAGTFEGNQSSLIATFNSNSILSNELSFRFRVYRQSAHLLTIKNLANLNYFSFYLFENKLIYRDSNFTDDLFIKLDNQTYKQWTTLHFQWLENFTLIFNYFYEYKIHLTFQEILSSDNQLKITIGNGFRGCFDYVLIGKNLYVPFYNDILIENDTRIHKIKIEQIENILINNCTFNNLCDNLYCHYGQCFRDFDQEKCLCNRRW